MTPKYLLKISVWPGDCDDARVSWRPCQDEAEADSLIQSAERPGFGRMSSRVVYEKFLIGAMPRGSVEVDPVTIREAALEFGPDMKIAVWLQGPLLDGPAIYWDSRGNSFAIVKPTEDQEGNSQIVSEQGVMLVSINGAGQIRWTCLREQSSWDENREAVDHFGLTWCR